MIPPRPRIVYAVTSAGNDFYSAMTRVCAASLRAHNPSAAIILATDDRSSDEMTKRRDPLLEEVDEHVSVSTPEGGPESRNRSMKTRLRALLSGPFLFMDSDMLVRSSLDDIFALDCDVAGAVNHSRDGFERQMWPADRETFAMMGWSCRNDAYINGGMIYYNDTPAAHEFGRLWHELWLESLERTGRYRDQPALNTAIKRSNARLVTLPHRYNAQFHQECRVAQEAMVWHYYGSGSHPPPLTEFEFVVDQVLAGRPLDISTVRKISRHSHPWRRRSWLDDLAAQIVYAKGNFSAADNAWFRGAPLQSLRLTASQLRFALLRRARRLLGAQA